MKIYLGIFAALFVFTNAQCEESGCESDGYGCDL
jgi:hypothetical protein